MEQKKVGKRKLTPQEKQIRQNLLKNETIEQRTKRVINPRLKTLFNKFDMLISSVNSPRYKFTPEQAKIVLDAIEKRTIALRNAFEPKTTKKETEKDIL